MTNIILEARGHNGFGFEKRKYKKKKEFMYASKINPSRGMKARCKNPGGGLEPPVLLILSENIGNGRCKKRKKNLILKGRE